MDPALPCDRVAHAARGGRPDPGEVLPYEELVARAVAGVDRSFPEARLLWRTTNAVCEHASAARAAAPRRPRVEGPGPAGPARRRNPGARRRFGGAYAAAARAWATGRAAAEADCRRRCPRFSDARPCGDEYFSRHATELQASAARRVLAATPRARVLDAWNLTAAAGCKYTFFRDGRHFDALDDVLALDAASRLAGGRAPDVLAGLAL